MCSSSGDNRKTVNSVCSSSSDHRKSVTVCVHANKKQFQFKINKNTFYLSKTKQCVHFLRRITDRQILSSKMVKNMMEVFADLL